MTKELNEIFAGKKIPRVTVVDYSKPEERAQLQHLVLRRKEILKRKEIDWQKVNSFVIKL